jgi:hypothetical protein
MEGLFGVALIAGLVIFCVELIKRLGRIALALEKLAGLPPLEFAKPNIG